MEGFIEGLSRDKISKNNALAKSSLVMERLMENYTIFHSSTFLKKKIKDYLNLPQQISCRLILMFSQYNPDTRIQNFDN